ncbi:hypothetical protein J3E64_001449 [Sphingobium sp. OAS761]|nr:hypothetical protein [Sphingobium sp. OAS761]
MQVRAKPCKPARGGAPVVAEAACAATAKRVKAVMRISGIVPLRVLPRSDMMFAAARNALMPSTARQIDDAHALIDPDARAEAL